MSKKRRTFSKEFKLEAIELSKTSGKSDTQLERELGLSRGSLYNWRKGLRENEERAFPGKGHPHKDEYTRHIERELEITRQERDILKKALAIFTPPRRS